MDSAEHTQLGLAGASPTITRGFGRGGGVGRGEGVGYVTQRRRHRQGVGDARPDAGGRPSPRHCLGRSRAFECHWGQTATVGGDDIDEEQKSEDHGVDGLGQWAVEGARRRRL